MRSNHIEYDYEESFERIDEIISESDSSFEELSSIPSGDKLTFTNGFYVKCSAIFVDIRESSNLTQKHTRPKLAKLYRSFISEVVSVLNGNVDCREINIVGDCVSGIVDTKSKDDINRLFSTACEVNSLVRVMNFKFKKAKIEQIKIGIGLSWGRALMIKAGYKGSGINDIIWMGDVVNEASNLCGRSNDGLDSVVVSGGFYHNLDEHRQGLLGKVIWEDIYHGDPFNSEMNKWFEGNCKESGDSLLDIFGF